MKSEFLKYLGLVILFLVWLNASMWLFNHTIAWIGIGSLVALMTTTILIIINNLKQNENEKK